MIMGMIIAMGHVSVPLVLIMGALRSVGQAFHMPAMESTMPLLVPKKHVVRVNTMNQSLWSMALVVGPVLGIFLYTVVGFQMVMFRMPPAAPLRLARACEDSRFPRRFRRSASSYRKLEGRLCNAERR